MSAHERLGARRQARAPIHEQMGREVTRAEPGSGQAEVHFVGREAFTNGLGNIQGGFLAALLDSTMGAALSTVLAENEVPPTLELKISFIRPGKIGPIVGLGQVVNRGRSVAFLEGELRGPDSKLIAKASATYRIFKEDSEQS